MSFFHLMPTSRFRLNLGLAVVLTLLAQPVHAQLPLLSQLAKLSGVSAKAPAAASPPTPSPAPLFLAPSHAAVMFNNQVLFQVYSSEGHDAQDRADLANQRLKDMLATLERNGDTAPPSIAVDEGQQEYVLRLNGDSLLTVTQADAVNNGQSVDHLADLWTADISQAFIQALRERQPSYLHWAFKRAGLFVLAGAAMEALLWGIARRWHSRPGWPFHALIWIVITGLIFNLFPQTRPINILLWQGALRPVTLFVFIALQAAALARLWAAILRRLFPPLPEHLSTEERTERTFRRRATLGDVARFTGVTVIWIVALLVALTAIGVNLPALLASAGLIGVALGLASQDSMKDLVAGINILADDRYGVGDNIQVGAFDGKVERLTLRITQIRDMAGRLITIPNRNIVEVANLTARWAQADFKVGVSYYDDVEQAMAVLEEAARKLAAERPDQVIGEPELLGVDSFNDANITLRLILKTPPGDQWAVARALRARVKLAFDAAGIAIVNAQYAATIPSPPWNEAQASRLEEGDKGPEPRPETGHKGDNANGTSPVAVSIEKPGPVQTS